VTETAKPADHKTLYTILGVVAALALAVGIYAYRGGFEQTSAGVAAKDKTDPDVAALMAPGPLPDIVVGSADAPTTIVEYASMTCPHCAQFQTEVFPELKTKYIDTGKVKYMLREFPLDNLAAAAFMLARCAGEDRYYPMVDAMFATQETWAVPGADGKEQLLKIARQAGMSKEQFDKCLGDEALFKKIVDTRTKGHDKFQVDSTPTFFVNGKRLKGDHQISDFQAAFGETPAAGDAKPDDAKPDDAKTGDAKTGDTKSDDTKSEEPATPAQ
jgi:protein-disulfide isomerase